MEGTVWCHVPTLLMESFSYGNGKPVSGANKIRGITFLNTRYEADMLYIESLKVVVDP